jgi:hypothetical protein
MAKLFYATKETWTMSAHHTDVTNWGYFVGKDDIKKKMALMVVEPAEELGIETLVLSECGHGYHALKFLLEDIIGRKPRFEVISMPELILPCTPIKLPIMTPAILPENQEDMMPQESCFPWSVKVLKN